MQKLIKGEDTPNIYQQTRAIHIVRAEPQKSLMIKRNHRFILCEGSHIVVFDDLARRPLVAMASSSDTLRISALAYICQEPSPAASVALVFDSLP